MAELNFGLLTPPGSQSIGNAFVSGMDQAAVARAQENQNALAQYTLSKARREDQVKSQLLNELRSAKTPEEQQQAYINAGLGKEAAEMRGIGLKNIETQGRINLQPGALAKQQDEIKTKTIAEIAGFPDSDSANAAIDARVANKTIDQATADRLRQGLTPDNFTKWKHDTLIRMLAPADQLKQSAVTTKDTDRGGFIERQAYDAQGKAVGDPIMLPKTAAPSTEAALMSAQAAARKWNPETLQFENVVPAGMTMRPPVAAGGAPVGAPAATMRLPYTNGSAPATAIPLPYTSGGAPATTIPLAGGAQGNAMAQPSINGMRPSAAPAATGGYSPRMLREMASKGMQPDGKGGQTFIPGGEKDPAVERQVANSRAAGAQTGKSDAIALEKLPNAIATGTELIRKLDALLGDAAVVDGKVLVPAKGIAPANGFENAFGLTGMAARAYPGSAAADFQAKVKEILGGAFLEAYETLRGAQGITDVEGRKATESRTRMSFDLSPAEFINAAREYRKTAAEALGRSETRLKSLKGSSVSSANRPSLDAIFATPEPR
jgi:hypothetical protein